MKTIAFTDYLTQFGNDHVLPPFDDFLNVANRTALKHRDGVGFYHRNLERGVLLYHLVQQYQPQKILEFGTGRGYSAMCMAQAMLDNKVDGHVWTIDIKQFDEIQAWAINIEHESKIEDLSLQTAWEKHFPAEVRKKITFLTGDSAWAVSHPYLRADLHGLQMVYIDGGHDYNACLHDFVTSLNFAVSPFIVLFDDYEFPGVRRVAEQCAESHVGDISIVKTLDQISELQHGQIPTEKDPGMVLMIIADVEHARHSFSNLGGFIMSYRLRRRIKFGIRYLLSFFR